MSDDEGLHDRVTRLLSDAEEHLAALEVDTDGSDAGDADEALRELAAEASELLSETDAGDLLEAVSSESIPEDERPDSLPGAIAQSGEEEVVTLRRLVALAKTDDAEEDSLAERRDELRDLMGLNDAESGGSEDAVADDADESTVTDEAESDDDPEGSGGSSFEDALRDTLDTLRDEMGEAAPDAPDGVAEATGSDGGDGGSGDGEGGGDGESDGPASSGKSRAVDGTMFSTMPSRNRPDVRGSPRVSNVRKKR